ncbi:CoA transferase [Arenibaculum sp.]|uniref:CaiB/BaiF CoA transferase family protein n=1 Tax=Arenibaculum sp. TaxID=2865862 RepID=UPI002E106A41|nr:CoA transferase [Arenibaculum sp.]
MTRLLAGVRVIDLSQYIPGPFAAQILADLGADVVKVEPPDGEPMRRLGEVDEDGLTPGYKLVNAGKSVLRLDLKDEEGRRTFAELLSRADVLVESYRPGTLERLGFGRERLAELNSGLVHVALSGWGQDGPYRLRAGHDVTYMAVGGGLAISGTSEAPRMAFPPTADYAAAVQAALAAVAGLFHRGRGADGMLLDVSLMETVLAWQGPSLTAAARGTPLPRAGGMISGGAAWYQVYRTADDRFMAVGAIEHKFWHAFCGAVERPDWIARHAEPMPQHALAAEVAALFASQPLAHWAALFDRVDCCVEPVLDPTEVPDHPHVRERGQIRARDGLVEALFGLRVDGGPPALRAPVRDVEVAEIMAAWRG